MNKLWVALYILILLIWSLTGGIHWGTALLITIISVIGAISVLKFKSPIKWKKSDDADGMNRHISAFHGFGFFGWMLLLMIMLSVISVLPLDNFLCGSYARGRTAYAIIMLVGFMALYVLTMRIAGSRQNMTRLTHALIAAGGVIVLMMGMKMVGFQVDMGQAGAASPFHVGLPVNPNHLSGVLVMMSLLSLGIALSKRHRDSMERRGLWFLIYIIFGIALVMLKSRGAILGWGVGHLVLIGTMLMASKQPGIKIVVSVFVALTLVLGGILYISAPTVGEITAEYEQTELIFDAGQIQAEDTMSAVPQKMNKTQMYADFVRMGKEVGVCGIGRSAFADVYPAYQGFPFPKKFRHAENEYFEIMLEYGWLFGACLLILGLIGWVRLFKTFVRTDSERGCIYGLLGAVMAVLVQNCFDFNLRYWTVGVPFWIALGILEARRIRWKYGRFEKDNPVDNKIKKVEFITGSVIAAIGILCILATAGLWYDGQTENKLKQLRMESAKVLDADKDKDANRLEQLIAENLKIRRYSAEVFKYYAYHYVRQASAEKGDRRESSLRLAREYYEKAQSHAVHDADISLHLAKTCHVLGDENCAVTNYIKTLDNDPRLRHYVIQEMILLKDSSLVAPNRLDDQKLFITSLMDAKRYDAAMNLIRHMKSNSGGESNAVELEYQLYQKLGFDEGCEEIAEYSRSLPLTIGLFRIRCETMIKHEQYNDLFGFMKDSELMFKDVPEYWRLRLYYSVYHGQTQGDEWYRSEVSGLFRKYRQVPVSSRNWRFDEALCEARYALGLEQYKRAERAAENALKLRPNHKEALKLLDAAKNHK